MSKSKNLSRDGFELIVEAAKALLDEPDLQRLIPRLLDLAFEVSGVERGYMLLRDSEGELSPVAQRGIEPGSLPEGDPSRVVVETALRERRPVLSTNAARDPRFTGSESIIIRGIRSTCCIPLETPGNRIGAFYLDAKGTGSLNEEQLPLLEAFGALAALSLARAMDLDSARRALEAVASSTRFPDIVGDSKVMCRLYDRMDRISAADFPVLITGASGTGKELIARALHKSGPRREQPFRAIFCGNLTPELLESELFGYKKGAFTGAIADKPGLLDLAEKGTLFLDEIGDVPGQVQAKLLRFLQDGDYQRLGDPTERKADVRILSATNKNLNDEIEKGSFREDLFYRLNVLTIEAPPLRDREGDIALLSATILAKVAARTGQPPRRLSPAALKRLIVHNWPGNVRELENVLARAAVLAIGDSIEPEDLDLFQRGTEESEVSEDALDLESVVEAHLKRVLKKTQGNRSEAARILGVSRRYLQKNLAKWREEETQ
ncbi:MAG: sigma-54-dependent Fis family transcriptional regulator [Calditrichaeota bacterium]|nr:sigma-54-dependent Fis family transcriptional regulator [Calditrichota bacterium]MBT7618284.1 sigma-54-dependent Fis family transcriptional regulator [Calditrichota bacterium]MBT7787323.1 sigma-54-dependent Fis family transcriptional regulator [Calditrichota bacterium]